jgi:hypothetical protein
MNYIDLHKNLENIKNVLIIVAHHDDEVLFTGGLLLYLFDNKINIYLLIVTDINSQNINNKNKYENFIRIINKFNIIYYELNIPNLINKNKIILEEYKKQIDNLKKKKLLYEIDEYKNLIEKYKKNINEYKKIYNDEIIYYKNNPSKIIEYNDFKNIYEVLINKIHKINEIIWSNNENNIKFNTILTHCEYGEYGHPQHILVYKSIKDSLDLNIFTDCQIYTFGEKASSYSLKINLDKKYELLKTYSFKDTSIKEYIWFNQCIKSYSNWCTDEYEYFNKIK